VEQKEFPDRLEIKPVGKVSAEVSAPPSKAYTLRALFLAALAEGESRIRNGLFAEDQKYAADALKAYGASIEREGNDYIITGLNGKPKTPSKEIFIGNSGVTARFLPALAALAPGNSVITGTERMCERPIKDLLDALAPLGVKSRCVNNDGCPPMEIGGGTFEGGETTLRGDKSSQYFSSIMISAPYAKSDVTVRTEGKLMSKPFIDVTIDMMEKFGAKVENNNYESFTIRAGKGYKGMDYATEGDYTNASYFLAAAAITRGKVKVTNLRKNSAQGDKFFVKCLEMMGCKVNWQDDYVELEGGALKGIEVNMADYPDVVPTLAVVAAFAEGTTRITDIGHLKIKECDRIVAPVTELKKMGIEAEALRGSMVIKGGKPHSAEIDTYNDHRMAMAFSVAGIKAGVTIKNPKCVSKSFPDFFEKFLGMVKR